MRKTIVVCIDWFDPGYKAGGPIRSAVNFVRHMQHDYDVYVFTGDRDLGSDSAYQGIQVNEWLTYDEKVKVFYCSPDHLNIQTISNVLSDLNPAVIYLNSMFSRYFTIYPLLISRRKKWKTKVVLAPRGMLRKSALQFKSLKKKVYLIAFKLFGFQRHIDFQATDLTEFTDISNIFGRATKNVLAPNWPGYIPPYPGSLSKMPGELRIIFIGRLHPIKNLDFLLECLRQVTGNIILTVVGNEEDKDFAARCRAMAAALSRNLRVDFRGEIPNNKLAPIIAEHHIFGLPTRGENFGHAIFEALASGKPALISDQTPWRNLQAGHAGWDLSLQEPQQFIKAMQVAADFGQVEYDQWSLGAWQHVQQTINNEELKIIYQKLFN
ncbi:glycosyltransferase [Paraflavitalea speifideaquila]|uniref:glycosyltransferase n=1 Tax=Paraflavitalea speifideaquila TaxID=3076558 RepID=UPI0028EF6A89|nr:glycosyltransferase [Paraflavitalea speifideiaquila]